MPRDPSPPQRDDQGPPNGTAVSIETRHHEQSKDGAKEQQSLPIEDDIMQLARLGEIGAIQKLFDNGKFDASYKDEQGITPLHWAAYRDHYALCHFLITAGADVNAKGGDVSATPVLWAARNCNYYVVNLLLQHGADPLKTDDQGFNLLQNATLDGNVYQLVLLLHQDVPVDIPDAQGHTSLMWAAYKGFPACVEALLQWGASISVVDETGFTALHWALVKGSHACILKLVEAGCDLHAKTNDGKTPSVVAREMKSTRQWQRALSESGYNFDGTQKRFPLWPFVRDRVSFISRFCFFWPFLIIFCELFIIAWLPIIFSVFLAIASYFALLWIAQYALKWGPSNMNHIGQTPFMAGIFAGTLFWVGVQYVRKILPATFSTAPILNISFSTVYVFCTYIYFLTSFEDPGYVPKTNSRPQQKRVIQELVEAGKFDELNFCVTCTVRKPLRSKHCRRCQRCIARHDHHCPWVFNCVGVNNHKHFVLYLVSMAIGIALIDYLAMRYLMVIGPSTETQCRVLNEKLCAILNADPFTICTVIWTSLQFIWVTMLLSVQLLQIARAQTTYENMKGIPQLDGAAKALTTAIVSGTTSADDAGLTGRGMGPDPASTPPPAPPARESCFQTINKALGLDTTLALMMHGSRAGEVRERQKRNPFTRGMVTNCQDFFCDSTPILRRRENGKAKLGRQIIDYTILYQPPPRTRIRVLPFEGPGGDINYQSVMTEDEP